MSPGLHEAETLVSMAIEAMAGDSASLSAALDELSAPIYVTDPQGVITYFNRACIDVAGRTPVAHQDKWCVTWKLHTLEGDPLPHDRCPMAVAIRSGCLVRGEEAIAERPDGTRIRFIPYPTPVFVGDGEMMGAVNLLLDVTGLRQAEALRQQAARCRRLADSIGDSDTAATLRGMAAQYEEEAAQFGRTH